MDMLSSHFRVDDQVYEWFQIQHAGHRFLVLQLAAVALICSVPQGSVIGPLLFIAYTEDAENLIETFCVKDDIYTDKT